MRTISAAPASPTCSERSPTDRAPARTEGLANYVLLGATSPADARAAVVTSLDEQYL